MGKVEILDFAGPEQLAEAAAREWLKELAARRGQGGPYSVALSGGRIARTFLSAAANLMQRASTPSEWPHFYWSDERCVPPDDIESNFRLANEALLLPLKVPGEFTHRIRGEYPPERAASTAELEMRRFVTEQESGQPVLDLVFLGLGEEGHVASLFPGEPEAAMLSAAVFRAVVASKPPPHRITLGYPAIAAARQVWVLASGPGKKDALRQSLTLSGATPLGRVLRMRKQTRIFTDIRRE